MNAVKILVSVIFLVGSSFAQPDEEWVYQHGTSKGIANSIVYGLDGNLYATGYTHPGLTVVSLTPAGEKRWCHYDAGGNCVTYGLDGNIYAAASSIISLTSDGEKRWEYSGSPPYGVVVLAIVYGADSNLYVAGGSISSQTSHYDFTVVSVTSSGEERWVYRWNGSDDDRDGATSIVYGPDGNIYVAGYVDDASTLMDFIVVSLTLDGDVRWIYRYDGPGHINDAAYSLTIGPDGNIYATGTSANNIDVFPFDFVVISLTPGGDENWVYRYNGPAHDNDVANAIAIGQDKNIYAGGWSNATVYNKDFLAISLTQSGDERWVYQWNGPGNDWDMVTSLACGGKDVYIAGVSWVSYDNKDLIVSSLNSLDGSENWVYQYDSGGEDWATSIIYGGDKRLYVAAGARAEYVFSGFFTVIKLNPESGVEENVLSSEVELQQVSLFPSVVRDALYLYFSSIPGTFNLSIYNLLGQIVYQKEMNSGDRLVKVWLGSDIPVGVYFLIVENHESMIHKKFMHVK